MGGGRGVVPLQYLQCDKACICHFCQRHVCTSMQNLSGWGGGGGAGTGLRKMDGGGGKKGKQRSRRIKERGKRKRDEKVNY
jgi:hypothetical protein